MSATITAHVSCNGYLLFFPILTGALSLRESAVATAFSLGFFGFSLRGCRVFFHVWTSVCLQIRVGYGLAPLPLKFYDLRTEFPPTMIPLIKSATA